jgi:predicted nucleic acid-binding protein
MTLVDTSVWIEFFRQRDLSIDDVLVTLMENGEAVALSAVFGELLQGAKNEEEERLILEFWASLPKIEETQLFIEAGKLSRKFKLVAKGVGLLDSYILSACKREKLSLWTLDKKLHLAYSKLSG